MIQKIKKDNCNAFVRCHYNPSLNHCIKAGVPFSQCLRLGFRNSLFSTMNVRSGSQPSSLASLERVKSLTLSESLDQSIIA